MKNRIRSKRSHKLFNLVMHYFYCKPKSFTVKGKHADVDDFGEMQDLCPELASEFGCGDMHFIPKPAADTVLKKYSLTADEYNEICETLEDELSFGHCGLCV